LAGLCYRRPRKSEFLTGKIFFCTIWIATWKSLSTGFPLNDWNLSKKMAPSVFLRKCCLVFEKRDKIFPDCFASKLFLLFLTCSDVDYDDKRVSLIRRIDFAWALEEEDELKKKKQKKSSKDSVEQWKWKGMVENLQLAHQELTVIIDLIDTVSDSC